MYGMGRAAVKEAAENPGLRNLRQGNGGLLASSWGSFVGNGASWSSVMRLGLGHGISQVRIFRDPIFVRAGERSNRPLRPR